MDNVNQLIMALIEAKQDEADAKSLRLDIEDQLAQALRLGDDFRGTQHGECGDNVLTVTGKTTIKVDTDKLLEIIEETKRGDLIGEAFNVKFSFNKRGFDALPNEDQKLFSDAITEKPAKVSFTIKTKKGD